MVDSVEPRSKSTVRRATLNYTRRGSDAVASIKSHLGTDNETDAVNRGLDFASQILKLVEEGGTLCDKDGTSIKIIIL